MNHPRATFARAVENLALLSLGTLLATIGGCSTAPLPSDAGTAAPPDSGGPRAYAPDCLNFSLLGQGLQDCIELRPSAETPSAELTCAEQGIKRGTPCQLGDTNCLERGPLVGHHVTDASTECFLVAEHMSCLPEELSRVGCAGSTAKVKKHIEYLTPTEVAAAAREIRDLPLVRYRYKTQGDGVTPTVGIIIEDVPGASFVDHENQRVNLYSFVSATAAAYQAQAKELEGLKARLAAVEATCARANHAPVPPAPSPSH